MPNRCRLRALLCPDADERHRLERAGHIRKGAVRRRSDWIRSQGALSLPHYRLSPTICRAPAARPWWWRATRTPSASSTSRTSLRRHQGPLPATAPDGHPHGHDHRRQPAYGRRHRRRGRVDDYLAQATPEKKMELIRQEQARQARRHDRRRHERRTGACPGRRRRGNEHGHDGRQRAGNMVDLDSNPTKLIEIVEIGKQLLMTRGALTPSASPTTSPSTSRFIPAIFVATYPTSTN